MNFDSLPNPPKMGKLSRQTAVYEKVDIDPTMAVPLPFSTNAEHFFNLDAFKAAGIDVGGFAKQADQLVKENTGNTLNAAIRGALKKNEPLPDQARFDAIVANYDFSGVRTSSEEGLSPEEKAERAEIRNALRRLLSEGSLSPDDTKYTVQTAKEAKDNILPDNKIPRGQFEELVESAVEGQDYPLFEGFIVPFSEQPALSKSGHPKNISGVLAIAREYAQRALELKRMNATRASLKG